MLDPRDQAPNDFLVTLAPQGIAPEAGRRLIAAVLAHDSYSVEEWGRKFQVPKVLSALVDPLPRLKLDAHITSPTDGFQKLRFTTDDQLAIETVLIPLEKPGAVSLCLSSQVGCVMGCVFCATARMTRRRNLATWEIIDQFAQARALARSQGRRVTGVVFMGMGEPFLNYDAVIASCELLRCSFGAQITSKAITISTVGLVPEIRRYIAEKHRYRLSISLGAATDAKRATLVPVAARAPLSEVMQAACEFAVSRKDRVMLSYVCISGINVSEDDARELGEVIGSTPVRLDLIDVTDPTGRFLPPTDDEMRIFRDALTRYVGQPVVRRYSGGKDIQAACGTLAGMTN